MKISGLLPAMLLLLTCAGDAPAQDAFGTAANQIHGISSPPPVARSIETDEYRRVTSAAGKDSVSCPDQDDDVAVILIIGQSNSSNYAERAHKSEHGKSIVNFFNGKCYVASSPLLGADGSWGEPWTLLGNKLVTAGIYKKVVLVSSGIGDSRVQQWKQGGELNSMLMDVLESVRKKYRITAVTWTQGESDYVQQTPFSSYLADFRSLVASLRQHDVNAPVFVTTATRCGRDSKWTADNPVARAQRALPDPQDNVFEGPDADRLVDVAADRKDGCHYGASGQEKFAQAWVDIFRRQRQS